MITIIGYHHWFWIIPFINPGEQGRSVEIRHPSSIQGASVVMDGIKIKTDNNGEAMFFNVADGKYKYTVSKRGYKRISGIVIVNNNADASIPVQLTLR